MGWYQVPYIYISSSVHIGCLGWIISIISCRIAYFLFLFFTLGISRKGFFGFCYSERSVLRQCNEDVLTSKVKHYFPTLDDAFARIPLRLDIACLPQPSILRFRPLIRTSSSFLNTVGACLKHPPYASRSSPKRHSARGCVLPKALSKTYKSTARSSS